jgi:tRNA threonylcarbamoyladenosine biosynthesis protein TsaE
MIDPIQNLKFTLDELPKVASALLQTAGNARIFLFEGPMGSGKTTLIREMCRQLGSNDNFSSPTFSLINEYSSKAGKLYHLDLYRLKGQNELLDLGIEEYLDSGSYMFIEWPELLLPLINQPYISVIIRTEYNFRYISAGKISA